MCEWLRGIEHFRVEERGRWRGGREVEVERGGEGEERDALIAASLPKSSSHNQFLNHFNQLLNHFNQLLNHFN